MERTHDGVVDGRQLAVRLLTVLAVVVVVLLGAPIGRAMAHAELLQITPADGQILDAPPSEAVLTFNEPVSLTGGSAAVLDDRAAVVSTGAETVGSTVVIALPSGLRDGTYTLTWAVVSADSHRITGASVFHVGAPSTGGVVVDTGGDDVGWGVRFGASALTAIAYAGALFGVGGWWWMAVLAGRRESERLELPVASAWRSVVVRAMVLGAGALVAAFPFRVARVGGGLDALRDDDFLRTSLRGPIGVSTIVTAVGLLLTVGLVGRAPASRTVAWAAGATGAVAFAGFAIEGHTRSQRPLGLMAAFDLLHLAAAAFWIGGLVGLVVAFRASVDPARLGYMVRRFSSVAVIAVVLVAAAGVGMTWIVLPAPGDLLSTGYGLALLTKVVLVAVVVALGAYNNRWLVPVDTGTAAAEPRRRLERIVQIEVVLLLAVVATTSVLVARSPVTSAPAAAPPATVPADAVELTLSGGAGTVSVAVAPARAGSNEIRFLLFDPSGRPLEPIETPTVELTEPTLALGPLRPVVHPFDAGDFHVIADIPIAGSWELTIRVRISEFEASTAATTVAIAA